MSEATLTLRGADVAEPPQTIDEKYSVVLRDCLDATRIESPPLQQYVERIDALTHSPKNTQDGGADVEAHLDALWNVLLDVVGQIQIDEADDKRMKTLARLIVELSKLDSSFVKIWVCRPSEDDTGLEANLRQGANTKLWEDLPLLGPMLRDNWNGTPA
jgi:hypothetical protein